MPSLFLYGPVGNQRRTWNNVNTRQRDSHQTTVSFIICSLPFILSEDLSSLRLVLGPLSLRLSVYGASSRSPSPWWVPVWALDSLLSIGLAVQQQKSSLLKWPRKLELMQYRAIGFTQELVYARQNPTILNHKNFELIEMKWRYDNQLSMNTLRTCQ